MTNMGFLNSSHLDLLGNIVGEQKSNFDISNVNFPNRIQMVFKTVNSVIIFIFLDYDDEDSETIKLKMQIGKSENFAILNEAKIEDINAIEKITCMVNTLCETFGKG